MSIQTIPFRPIPAATVNIDVSASSQSIAIGTSAGRQNIRIVNDGTATAFVSFGPTGVTASLTTAMPVGPGVHEVITIEDYGSAPYMAAIAVGSTGKVYATPGIGF